MNDFDGLSSDIARKQEQLHRFFNNQLPQFVAGAAERLKDANFSAEGFIVGGTSRKWNKRKKETRRSRGKRTLYDTGNLQNSIKAIVVGASVGASQRGCPIRVIVGVDTALVPYARILSEGGRSMQYVKPHHRRNSRGGRSQVRAFSRRLTYPARPFVGFSPDIFKSADKDARQAFNQIFR